MVIVLGFAVVLGLAVITTGALVEEIGTISNCVDAIVLASVYLFVVDVLLLLLLNCKFRGDVEEYGNKSIIIGSEDGPRGGRFSITLRFAFAFAV